MNLNDFIKSLSLDELKNSEKMMEFLNYFEKENKALVLLLEKFKNEKIIIIQIILSFLSTNSFSVLSVLKFYILKEEQNDFFITSSIFNALVKYLEQMEEMKLMEPILDIFEIILKDNETVLMTKFKVILEKLIGIYLKHSLSSSQKKRIQGFLSFFFKQ
jgi:hypothetical protein